MSDDGRQQKYRLPWRVLRWPKNGDPVIEAAAGAETNVCLRICSE